MVVMVGLDEIAPDLACGFLPDQLETSISASADGKTLFIQEGSASFVDTGFYFDIQENCEDVQVQLIDVTNEQTGPDNKKLVDFTATRYVGSVEQAISMLLHKVAREIAQVLQFAGEIRQTHSVSMKSMWPLLTELETGMKTLVVFSPRLLLATTIGFWKPSLLALVLELNFPSLT